ncbi:MAG TPA: hypothetical protein VN042_13960 [Asticcacaulis sp.]|nr:hypothetical protein [Asticcacaulis sp.]
MIKLFVPAALAGAAFLGLSVSAQAADCSVRPVHKPVAHKTIHKAPARKAVVKKVVHRTVIRKAGVGCGCGVPERDTVRHPVIMRPDGAYFIDGVPQARRVEVREIVVTPMRHQRYRHHHHPRW